MKKLMLGLVAALTALVASADAKAKIAETVALRREKIAAFEVKTEGKPEQIARSRMEKCRLILGVAQIYSDQMGDVEKALATYDEAIAMKEGDAATRFAALTAKSNCLRRRKRGKEALPLAEEAMKISEVNPDLKLAAPAYGCRAQALSAVKRWDEAIADFLKAAELGPKPVQLPAELYESVLWVTRSGRHAEAHKYLERIRAISGLHPNCFVRTYEIDARTYNAESRPEESLKLYGRLLSDSDLIARADAAELIIAAAKWVKPAKSGFAASFEIYDRVLGELDRYRLTDKQRGRVLGDYVETCWRSMDRKRIKEALALGKRLGADLSQNMATWLDFCYDEMASFPKDEKDIVIPTDARDLGFDPDRKVVKASSFGWNPTNATECLQKAMDSDASTVVVDATPSPWYIWSVKLRRQACSNRKIVFSKGVVVLSAPEHNRKGEPGWYRDDLFCFEGCTNLWIEGEGDAAKHDTYIGKYRNRAERLKAGFSYGGNGFHGSCRRAVLRNLYVANCGQDALCWGGKRSFVIDCVFDDNYRQGMSLSSASEFCVYKNVTFCNTFGGEPHCGVDFEPYYEVYSMPFQYFFDCKFYNNAAKNVEFATSTYAPMAAYFKRCQFEAQRNGNIAVLARAGIYKQAFCHAPSNIIFDECRIDGYSDGYGNPIQFLSTFLYDVTFRNCVINDKGCLLKGTRETASPIHLVLDRATWDGFYPHAGVVTFENVKVNGYDNVPLVQVTDTNGKYGVNTFRGTIDWNGKSVDMSKFSYLPPDRDRKEASEPDVAALNVPAGSAVPWEPCFEFPFRHSYYNPLPVYMVFASGKKGAKAEFTVRFHCRVASDVPVTAVGPDGQVMKLGFAKTGDNAYSFELPADGVYSVNFNVPSKLADEEEAREGFSILSARGVSVAYQAGLTRLGRVAAVTTGDDYPEYTGYFEVPAGKDCMVKLQSGGLELRNAAGDVVVSEPGDMYSGPKFFSFRSERNEIWSFTALGQGATLKFFEPLTGIWADDPAWLPTLGKNLPFHRLKRGRSSAAEMPKAVLLPLPIKGRVAATTDKAVADRLAFSEGTAWANKYAEAKQHYRWMEPAMQRPEDLKAMAIELESLEPIRKMRDMEAAAKRESPDLRRYVAFVATYAPVLALEDAAAKAWAKDLEEPDDDGFGDKVNAAIERFGLEWTEDGIYYADYAGILKVVPFIVQRLNALGLNK